MQSIGSSVDLVSQYHAGAGVGATSVQQGKSLESAAKGMEGTFLAILLKEMRQGLEQEGMFGKDNGDVLGGMFDQFMSQHLMQAGGVGLARSIKHQLEAAKPHEHHANGPHLSKRA